MQQVSAEYIEQLLFTRQTVVIDGREYPWYLGPAEVEGAQHDLCVADRELYDRWKHFYATPRKSWIGGTYLPTERLNSAERDALYWELVEASPAFFIHHHLPIVDKDATLGLFDHWNILQRRIYWLFLYQWKNDAPVRIDVLKPRQVGSSTVFIALAAWWVFLHENQKATIMADKEENTLSLFGMVENFYDGLADSMPPSKVPQRQSSKGTQLVLGEKRRDHQANKKKTKEEKEESGALLNSSVSISTASARVTKKGFTGFFFLGSEMDFWPNPVPVWSDVSNAIPDSNPKTIIIRESTANAPGGWWNKQCDASEAHKGRHRFIFVGWKDCPVRWSHKAGTWVWEYASPLDDPSPAGRERFCAGLTTEERGLIGRHGLTLEQIRWRQLKIADSSSGDEGDFRRQYPLTKAEAFLAAGKTALHPEAVEYYQQMTAPERQPPPLFRGNLSFDAAGMVRLEPDPGGYTRIWRYPEPGRLYILGADPSEGSTDGDPESAQVIDDIDIEQCAHCFHNGDDRHFAMQTSALARFYHDAFVVPERTGNGTKLVGHINPATGEYPVENLYVSEMFTRVGSELETKFGHSTNRKTKPIMVGHLRDVTHPQRLLKLHCPITASQMGRYVRKRDDRVGFGSSAQQSGDDDALCALELALVGRASPQFDGIRVMNRFSASRVSTRSAKVPDEWLRQIEALQAQTRNTEVLMSDGSVGFRPGPQQKPSRPRHEILGSCA